MPYNEKLANKVREALAHLPNVEEKNLFQGLAFMVDEKICVSVKNEEIMCRINPNIYEDALERTGCRPMIHGSRTMKGFVFINEDGYKRNEDFNFWMELAINFNKEAKASKKKKTSNK